MQPISVTAVKEYDIFVNCNWVDTRTTCSFVRIRYRRVYTIFPPKHVKNVG
jgi:hypothetical protein